MKGTEGELYAIFKPAAKISKICGNKEAPADSADDAEISLRAIREIEKFR